MPKPRLFMPNRLEKLIEKHFGSYKVARAFGQLHYWSTQMPNGFYKFKQPCKNNPLYKKGDSWGEDLGMNRWELDPIFKRLVNHHASKSQYRKSSNKFDGKMFCSYKDCKDNRTYYFMNKEVIDQFLASLNLPPPLPVSIAKSEPKEVDEVCGNVEIMSLNPSRNVDNPPSPAHTHPDLLYFQTNTSLSESVPGDTREMQKEQEKLSSKKMVELWNSHTQDKVIWYPSTAFKLYKVLSDFFGGCLEAFRKYCAAISNTNFLMGKSPNSKFKAFFYWAIKPEVIKSIFQGAYGVQDILSQIGNISEQDGLKYQINTVDYEILNVEKKIQYSKQEIIDAQDKMIKEHRQTVDQQVKGQIMERVQEEVDQKYPLARYSQKDREMLVSVQYHTALINHSRAKLKLCNPEDIVVPVELISKKKALQESRAAMCKRFEKILIENSKVQKDIKTLVGKAA